MKKIIIFLSIILIATSCNLQAKKSSIGEVDLNGKKVYVYPFGKNHQVVGIWTSTKFNVIHDPDCPCMKKTNSFADSLAKKVIQDININVYTNKQK